MITIPLHCMSYIYATRGRGTMRELLDIIHRGDQRAADQLVERIHGSLDRELSAKELRLAAVNQHSSHGKALQEFVQNSMDAYDAIGMTGGVIEFRHRKTGDGQTVEISDSAGGLAAEDFLGLPFTVGASKKPEGAIGGRGQGMKAAYGLSTEVTTASRNLWGKVFRKNGEYKVSFDTLGSPTRGLGITASGLPDSLNIPDALSHYCSKVDPARYRILLRGEQINTMSRVSNPEFVEIGEVKGAKVYATPTLSGTSLTWLQRGLHVSTIYQSLPLNLHVDLPGGKKYLLTGGRDQPPEWILQAVNRKLGGMIEGYAGRLLELERPLSPAEVSFISRFRPDAGRVVRYLAAAASVSAVGVGLQWALPTLSTASVAAGKTSLAMRPDAVSSAPGLSMTSVPPVAGFLGLVAESFASGLISKGVYNYLVERETRGRSNALPVLVRDTTVGLWKRFKGLFPPSFKRVPILPVLEQTRTASKEYKISITQARQLSKKGMITVISSPVEAIGKKGIFIHKDYEHAFKEDEENRINAGQIAFCLAALPAVLPVYLSVKAAASIYAAGQHAAARARLRKALTGTDVRLLPPSQAEASEGKREFAGLGVRQADAGPHRELVGAVAGPGARAPSGRRTAVAGVAEDFSGRHADASMKPGGAVAEAEMSGLPESSRKRHNSMPDNATAAPLPSSPHAPASPTPSQGGWDGNMRMLRLVDILSQAASEAGGSRVGTGFVRAPERGSYSSAGPRIYMNMADPDMIKIIGDLGKGRLTPDDLLTLIGHVTRASSEHAPPKPSGVWAGYLRTGYKATAEDVGSSILARFSEVERQINNMGVKITGGR